jgi:RimJ/RimL family protein N-acetyltransferase
MLIAGRLKPFTVTGYVTGVADPEAPLDYHKLTKSDAMTMFFALRENSENLATMFEWGLDAADYSLATVQRYCEHNSNDSSQQDFIFFSNGQFVGQGAVLPHRDEGTQRQLGMWVDKKLQGQGFGTKMVEILENEAFANPDVEALFYLHDSVNKSSAAVAEKSLFLHHCNFEQPVRTASESGGWQCLVKTRELFDLLSREESPLLLTL